ncbi:TerB family tellurite resistance protein [Rhodoplanes sp. Z2-YC6860]|uniref:TerB family tellurite resistance protein n=1 Tax=Rhodoplanes sp. Z2-YC6860 TaxID=674703 RepID=UPI0012EEB436|nr:TerB family tellurite resistance protein [Rhodoplanes sp. Z2-YC6860]
MGGLEHIQQARAQRRDAERKRKALESQRSAPMQAVDDPRDAALVLMLLIARNSDAPSREQYAAIEDHARRVFGFEHDLAERMTHARFVASRAESFEQAFGLFGNLFRARLTEAERRELVDMVEAIATLDGPSEPQRDAIDTLRRRFATA